MAQPIKTVRTARGVRYMRGGRFISKASAARSRAAKRRAKKNPVKKTTTRKRVVRKAAPKRNVRKAVSKRRVVRRKTVKRRVSTPRKDPKRVAAGKKAARTRKRKAAARSAAAKKAASKRKRTTTKRRRNVPKKKRITKKMRQRWGRKGGKAAARKRKRRRNPMKTGQWRKKTTGYGKRKKRRTVSKARFLGKKSPKSKKRKSYRIARRKTRKGNYGYRLVRTNPVKAMKSALMQGAAFWAGLMGMRVINNAIQHHVTGKKEAEEKTKDANSAMAKLLPIVPSLAGFVLATAVVPKVVKKRKFTDALAMGATVAMIDAVFNTFVKPKLLETESLKPYFLGAMGEMTVYEPVAEYVDYDNRLGGAMGGMDDYVPDNRYGQFMVTEALAMDEVDYMQRGGAGGVFAKTTLGRG